MNAVEHAVTLPADLPARYRAAASLLLRLLAGRQSGSLVMRLPDGSVRSFGTGAPQVSVTVNDWRFFWRVLTASDIGVGEAYMEGEFTCSDLVELCRLFLREQSVLTQRSWRGLPARIGHALLRRARANTLAGSRRNIRHHYDLGNDLYRLFLDEAMVYSCAVFEREHDDLESAQRAKLDGICRQVGLAPGMAVLEIGSGWGALALHAAREYGCRVTAITLSEEQLRLARARVAAAGLEEAVDFRLCDYRSIAGRFDRIMSIEMFEAVGYEFYGAFFGACSRLLARGGRMFLQTINMPDQHFDRYRRDFDFVKKYIFPGGALASLQGITAALKRHTDLRIDWLRDIGPHYARTLRCWRERFMARLAEVRQLGFDDRFIRMWEFYLACCEAAFSVRHIGDLQIVLVKPD
jgi:cyclopropane-fatty-acyl-phospholipid synthase